MNQRTSIPPASPRSYVVRVYRRTRESLIGQVQDVQTGRVRPFRDIEELWAALGGQGMSAGRKTSIKEKRR
jgi:hypothetical protein